MKIQGIKSQLFLIIPLIIFSFSSSAQWITGGFTFEGRSRQYRTYVPSTYTASKPASLVFALYGLGGNMTNFSNGVGMKPIADTANIIFVTPEAVNASGVGTAWNSGCNLSAFFPNNPYPNSNVNDVGFINALIDTMISKYVIDQEKIYCFGFSLGGYMTQRLACELNNRISSFASVAGTIGPGISNCNPGKAISIAHFHGTNDQTVTWNKNSFGIGVDSLITFWVQNNQCNSTPIHTDLPNSKNDGFTVETFLYKNSDPSSNAEVELFKVNSGGHIWLNSAAHDISYTTEIWKFFDKDNVHSTTFITENTSKQETLIFPNPTNDFVTITLPVSSNNTLLDIFNHLGQEVYSQSIQGELFSFSLKQQGLLKGIYLIRLRDKNNITTRKILYTE